jgi:predicted component of type VI protein secretion system
MARRCQSGAVKTGSGKMRRSGAGFAWGTIILGVILALFVSCSKKPDVPKLPKSKIEEIKDWPYEDKAIKLKFRSDANVNIHNQQNHTLFVCIYQLIDPNAFKDLTANEEGVKKLLACQRFDTSIASSDRLIVHPSEEETRSYARAEKAKWVAVVAGYYHLWPYHVFELIQVPVKIEKSGIIFKKAKAVPGPLDVSLYFGPEEIQRIQE